MRRPTRPGFIEIGLYSCMGCAMIRGSFALNPLGINEFCEVCKDQMRFVPVSIDFDRQQFVIPEGA